MMDKDAIDRMVNRFLGWKLPETFSPDGGINFLRPVPGSEPWRWPTGTNLFTATEAKAMIRHMIADELQEAK